MRSIRWGRALSVGIAMAALSASSGAAGQPTARGKASRQLIITSAHADVEQGLLTIFGRNFGARAPRVFLAGEPLEVISATSQEVLAELPAIEPGTYLLTVSRGSRPLLTDSIDLGVCAAGLEGPPGPQGPMGPQGLPGPQGERGDAGAPVAGQACPEGEGVAGFDAEGIILCRRFAAEPPDPPDPQCGDVVVEYSGSGLPSEIGGLYREAFDCQRYEGGAWFGGVDYQHCFRKHDGSTWRVWNTGCGWEVGLVYSGSWERLARTYTGLCSAIPPEGLTTTALTTTTFFDPVGSPIEGLASRVVQDGCGP